MGLRRRKGVKESGGKRKKREKKLMEKEGKKKKGEKDSSTHGCY